MDISEVIGKTLLCILLLIVLALVVIGFKTCMSSHDEVTQEPIKGQLATKDTSPFGLTTAGKVIKIDQSCPELTQAGLEMVEMERYPEIFFPSVSDRIFQNWR